MKKLLSLLLVMLLVSVVSVGAKSRRVSLKTPGTLATLIGERQKFKITDLTIEGALNGSDLRFLREMAGSDFQQQPTEGRLRRLDLSRATFARGGEPYIFKDTCVSLQGGPLTVPHFAFRGCRLEQVVLPERMDTIGVGAFEYTALRSIRIPEDVVVMSWVFNRCDSLAQVEFPQRLVELGQNSFRDCGSLRTLRIHDVQYLPYHVFQNVTGVEEVVIDGVLMHVDGWFCDDCPRLRRIEFGGMVLSTGGQPIASNCPQLSQIAFSGLCFPMNFGSVENCPLVKKCDVTGIVLSSYTEFIPSNTDPTTIAVERIREFLQYIKTYLADLTENNSNLRMSKYMKFTSGNVFYNLACICALKGMKDEALQMLEKSYNHGYVNYKHASVDKDLLSLHGDAVFEDVLKRMQVKWDQEYNYLIVLRQSPAYSAQPLQNAPVFTYASPTDSNLVRVREFFKLDSIAGNGDELSRIKNIMYWLHDEIPHNGSGGFPSNTPRNAIDLYKACKSQQRGLNCRGLALVLSELYLAMGWPARALTCQSKKYDTDPDCHVIDMVWSRDLNKWIWMDPSFAAFVTDENGLLLHPGEVRQRLIDNKPLVLNEDANWNHKSIQTKEHYLEEYMAKNLYFLSVYQHNKFGLESPETNRENYYTLAPEGSEGPNRPAFRLSDEQWFWQAPVELVE